MIRIFSYSSESNRMETPPIAELPQHLNDGGRTIWVDLENPTDEETGVLGGIFGFHILSVEDCIDDSWLPKEDAYDGYTYSVFHAAAPTGTERLVDQKLDVFVGANYLVTHHHEEIKGIFDTRGVVAKNPGSLLRSSDWLLHGILNTVIDYCKPAMDALEERVNRIADAAGDVGTDLAEAIDLHEDLSKFLAITKHQSAALERFAYSEQSFVAEENRDYFRDVHDHNRHLQFRLDQGLKRLTWALETVRAADTRRTQTAVRLGTVFLTAVSVPLVVINLMSLEAFGLSENVSSWVSIGVTVAWVGVSLALFKQKKWF